jgi:uroporphyrin-III C-methyltransferase/precorrin-2 dehydrogenase/sirohydrochlorin ferrochelatase
MTDRPRDGTGHGLVSLVGAGPGDPDLLTRRALRRLRAADLVLHDGLVPSSIVRLARAAECVSVARRAGPKSIGHDEVVSHLIAAAKAGLRTVRLKAGDPFVFGRGGEELDALMSANVRVEVVPGLTSATAAPCLAGIPLTERGVTSAFVVLTGHAPEAYEPLIRALPAGSATVVVLMGLSERHRIRARLLEAGWAADTPAAILLDASRPGARTWTGPLANLGAADGVGTTTSPGVLVIGHVTARAARFAAASLSAEEISWPL